MTSSSSNGDESRGTGLEDLSAEEMARKVEGLEKQLASARRREIEIRRGKDQPQQQQGSQFKPTHCHEDGYEVVTHQRVAILVDVQNMYYAARNLYNSKLEFSKLLSHATRGRRLTRAIAS